MRVALTRKLESIQNPTSKTATKAIQRQAPPPIRLRPKRSKSSGRRVRGSFSKIVIISSRSPGLPGEQREEAEKPPRSRHKKRGRLAGSSSGTPPGARHTQPELRPESQPGANDAA